MNNENDEKKVKVTIAVNELDDERMQEPDVKEFTELVNNLFHKCDEKKIPIICLASDSNTSVSVLGANGSPIDFVVLLSEAIKKIPQFDMIVKAALDYASFDKTANDSVASLIKNVMKEKDN